MLTHSTTAVLVAAATVSLAMTPPNFAPASTTDLFVNFNGIAALNGAVVAKATTAKQPTVGTADQLPGSSYALIMVDLDIPTNNPPATSTLLHWLQTGLTPATSATSITSTTGGAQKFFMLQPPGDPTAAYASYIAPNPPARVPLSHRYTQILVDTSAATTAELNALKKAAANRSGFSASAVLAQANLVNKVVAGNWFVVTNPGPAINSNVAGSGTESTANNISSDASVASESTSAALSSSTSGTSSLNVTGPPANSSSTATGTGTGTSTSTSTSSLPSTTDNDAGAMAPPRGALLGLFCASLIFFRL